MPLKFLDLSEPAGPINNNGPVGMATTHWSLANQIVHSN